MFSCYSCCYYKIINTSCYHIKNKIKFPMIFYNVFQFASLFRKNDKNLINSLNKFAAVVRFLNLFLKKLKKNG